MDFETRNLAHIRNSKDTSGVINIDDKFPGLIPLDAKSLILTVERGFLAFPASGTGCVSLRVMASRYSLACVLDRPKTQEWVIDNMGLDVIAQDVRMPITTGRRDFFYALRSTTGLTFS